MSDTAPRRTLHILGNAHLDPVWLWDWREGLNEGMVTCRTILDLMDEDPALTFVRGEAVIYDHIQRHDPATFARIQVRAAEGRWDVVGGTWLQADTNMPATEVFARHFARGQAYFRRHFGRAVRVAWTADSFGHSAGLPEIYAAAGIEGVALTRPDTNSLGIDSPAFWWEGPGGARVLAYRPDVGWYGCDRHDFVARLDQSLERAATRKWRNIGVFCGLGNHGGGPTRRHVEEIRTWAAAHPDVEVIWSGLHRLIDSLKAELAGPDAPPIPSHRGELNFVLRGCYVSMAGLKFPYRRCEAAAVATERTDVAIAAARKQPPTDLTELWDGVLFNSFHDILPGSSIERACHDQLEWLGGLLHQARRTEMTALNALAAEVDTTLRTPAIEDHPTTVNLLVWNPHPWAVEEVVELEAAVDYRPRSDFRDRHDEMPLLLLDAAGTALAHQRIAHEHLAFPFLPWRFRVAASLRLPPCGWQVVEFGWVPDAPTVAWTGPAVNAPDETTIAGDGIRVHAKPGATGVQIELGGRPLFGGNGLQAKVMEDPYGAWGDMAESAAGCDISIVRETWEVADVRIVERGPACARLWLRLQGKQSWLDLTCTITAGSERVDVAARLLWNERGARLKLVMPGSDEATYQVPGGTATRGPSGEVPGGRWARVGSAASGYGFVSDALYGFDSKAGEFRASVVRSAHFSQSHPEPTTDPAWLPATDVGEHQFKLRLTAYDADLDRAAAELERPPTTLVTPPSPGDRPRQGSLAALSPASVKMLGLKRAEGDDSLILQLQNAGDRPAPVRFDWQGQRLDLGELAPWRIAAWRLRQLGGIWSATTTDLSEI